MFLAAEAGVGIGYLNGELRCPLNDDLPVLGGNVVGNLGTVGLVAHHEHLQLSNVVDQEFPEA